MSTIARNVAKFKAANRLSPVEYGAVRYHKGQPGNEVRGVMYRLKNGQVFKLGVEAARQAGYPIWVHDAAPNA